MPGTKNKGQVSIFMVLPPPIRWCLRLDSSHWTSCGAADCYIPLPSLLTRPPWGSHRHLTLLSATLGSEFSLRKSLQHSWMSLSQRMAALFP